MSNRPTLITDAVYDYVLRHGVREAPALAALREETARQEWAIMQISPEQGALMALLAELTGTRRYLEIGVFTGYSTLAVALALPPDGRITALDKSEEWTAIARRHWLAAGVAERIELMLGDAAEAVDRLLAEGRADTYDFAFIDADKPAYERYYEACLRLVRPGGLIALDNMLFAGGVARSEPSGNAAAVDRLNRRIAADDRVSMVLLPMADGLTLCRRRA